jgi:hypothetical protein
MAKWEYLVIYTFENYVIEAGDEQFAELSLVQGRGSHDTVYQMESKTKGDPPLLGVFLNRIGREGWEVVSAYCAEHSGNYWRELPVTFIAKRPLG